MSTCQVELKNKRPPLECGLIYLYIFKHYCSNNDKKKSDGTKVAQFYSLTHESDRGQLCLPLRM